ncbi:MAG: PKD domain-containing protein [Limisphaerales bacterium]
MPNSRILFTLLCALATTANAKQPLHQTFDLSLGEMVIVHLPDQSVARVKLVDLKESFGKVWGEVYRAEVTLEVNGQRRIILSGMYNLPQPIDNIQIDCPITKSLRNNSHINHWQLEKDARLRIWPADSPWIGRKDFLYPVKQKWFANQTSFSNEPVAPRPKRQLYYHAGLDIGGSEGLVEVVAATDALVVSRGTAVLKGHQKDTPINQRYDVVYLLDARGWYYRYSHFHSIEENLKLGERIKKGRRLGLIGKEGGSGGWTHLHFEIKGRQPSGKWGTEEGYAFLWQSYLQQHQPKLIAVARPSYVAFTDQEITFDGSKSWSRNGPVRSYEWTHPDGSKSKGAITSVSHDKPGTYFSILKITDRVGNVDYDFVRAKIFSRKNIERQPPRLHATYYPTFNLKPGTEITFKARAFYFTHGEEEWDFGDGSPTVKTKSDGNVDSHAKDGYATIKHTYRKSGHYLVSIRRSNEHGHPATDFLHVHIE